ncbi:unnamed protein product [Linum trigynum]|uniref:Major facilitator superfamily (MFS) profile domain-containing protein n=1 Tax=Linum trigynum TaxID=586398 RepID=A0AAV2ESB5_9ROSI
MVPWRWREESLIMVCTFVSAFAWSWGPLGWLIPSETFPLETRSAGQSVTVCVNLLFTFVIAQAFLSMLCHFKFDIFFFFSGWVAVMSAFVFFLVPETKNVPIEERRFGRSTGCGRGLCRRMVTGGEGQQC